VVVYKVCYWVCGFEAKLKLILEIL